MLTFLWCGSAAAQSSGKILVVPAKGESGPSGKFAGLLRAALAKKGHPVVSGKSAPLLKKAHVTPKQLGQPAKLRKLAKTAKAGAVVVIEAVGSQVTCTMYAGSDGHRLAALPGSKPTPAAAQTAARTLADALSVSAEPEPASIPPPATDVPPAAAPPAADPNAPPPMAPPEPTTAPPPEAAAAAEPPPPEAGDGGWRPGLRVDIGGLFFQRNATLSTKGGFAAGVVPPCYCGTGTQANPLFPAFVLRADFYPLAIGGNGSAVEGIGITLDAFFTSVKSQINTTPPQTVSSFVWSGAAALAYRWVFVPSPLSPDLVVQVGYGYFTFPLPSSAFPGVSYGGLLVGLDLHIALGLPELVATVGGSVLPKLSVGNGADTMLGKVDGGLGIKARVGLSYAVSHFQFGVQGFLDNYSIPYTGSTALPTSSNVAQLTDVSLTDRLLGFMITAGFHI